ncbi:sulfide-dependent adenosine diphosphate thiazole synthase [Methanopyrus sp. SNP6]|uniref:sulfide-dependent adenosine diphosphate thiazole synthase n=1 Tax=Methanopyrus sp. SNP6 TaxID=1937005 RepID=UPI001F02AF3E|nr:sulfide-dependent adenosine diphosphate thiazole synthase [Methanopyrus sp. SNP6]
MRVEREITSIILREGYEFINDCSESDVIVVGAGPAGLTCAYELAKNDVDVTVVERKLYVGGGMTGGGMLFPAGVIMEETAEVLEEVGVELRPAEAGLLVFNPVEAAVKLANAALEAGARILVGVEVEDVIERRGRVCGVVVNWTAVNAANMHVDPLAFESEYTVDATGHEAAVCKLAGIEVSGEGPMWAERGEELVVKHTQEVKPGLFVAGMAASAVKGAYRMGPIFGGMLESGKRAAEEILERLT